MLTHSCLRQCFLLVSRLVERIVVPCLATMAQVLL